jgi:hypothetical protein
MKYLLFICLSCFYAISFAQSSNDAIVAKFKDSKGHIIQITFDEAQKTLFLNDIKKPQKVILGKHWNFLGQPPTSVIITPIDEKTAIIMVIIDMAQMGMNISEITVYLLDINKLETVKKCVFEDIGMFDISKHKEYKIYYEYFFDKKLRIITLKEYIPFKSSKQKNKYKTDIIKCKF